MNEREVNIRTKKALRGDLNSAREVIEFLWRFRVVPQARYVAYALVYQYVLNTWSRAVELCRSCEGKCCRQGPPLPIYDFDIEELEKSYPNALRYVEKVGSSYVLRRPCPLQEGWRCTVHRAKPYACLCYPFMVEEVAIPAIAKQLNESYPEIETPSDCPAGVEVKKVIDSLRKSLRDRLGREPEPLELLNEVVEKLELR